MRQSSGILVVLGTLLLAAHVAATAGMNPDSLLLERTPQEIRLTWSGDETTYVIYRSDQPSGVDSTSNEITRTAAIVYDDPLLAIPCESCFYLIQSGASFACGELTCSIDTEFCLVVFPGVPEIPPQYECQSIPTECLPSPTCPCVQGDTWPPLSADCSQSIEGAITISFFAP